MDIPYFNCLEDCPYDPFHLLYEGIQKRLLEFWILSEESRSCKARSKTYRLKPSIATKISESLIGMKCFVPVEFQRKTGNLWKLKKWKGTQFRFMLLYVGVVIFKKFFSKEIYENYLLLIFSIRKLSDPKTTTAEIESVQFLLECFVDGYTKIYGKEVVNHNVHGLFHLVENVLKHGPLEHFSTFLFESYLAMFNKFKHSSYCAAQQIVN